MPRPSLFLTVPLCAAAICAVTPRLATASPPGGPHVAWWLTNAASTALVHPGERLGYTVRLRQVRSPAKVTAWLCAKSAATAECTRVNELDVGNPMIVDDLAPVMAHASYNRDARGAAGTSISVQQDGASTVIIARPTRPGGSPDVGFSFSVTANHGLRPGTVIRNVAQVMFAVENIRPDAGALSNCPLNVPLFAHPFTNGNMEELAPSIAQLRATGDALPPSCFGTSVVPPSPGGPHTGFGGLAGHIGNVSNTSTVTSAVTSAGKAGASRHGRR
jgi:hypothetical protein